MDNNIFSIRTFKNKTGKLSVIELDNDLPFVCKNLFYIYDISTNAYRGNHAHKNCNEVIIAINGSCKISIDTGKSKNEIILDSPDKYVYIPAKNWIKYISLSENCILLVCSSQLYDKDEYIYDYNEFINFVDQEKL